MITVVFVRWGDWCSPHSSEYVNRLAEGVCRNLTLPHRMICFTDNPQGLDPEIEVRALPENLRGWWWERLYSRRKPSWLRWLTSLPYLAIRKSDGRNGIDADRWLSRFPIDLQGWYNKLYLFKPGVLSGTCLYIDLDTVIVGNLDEIADYEGDFCILRDFHHSLHYGSGLMIFRAEAAGHLWTDFVKRGCPILKNGDQAFIEQRMPDADFFQDRLPGQVVSYKVHCRKSGVPAYARIVCFHGLPRPHEISDAGLVAAWMGQRPDKGASQECEGPRQR